MKRKKNDAKVIGQKGNMKGNLCVLVYRIEVPTLGQRRKQQRYRKVRSGTVVVKLIAGQFNPGR